MGEDLSTQGTHPVVTACKLNSSEDGSGNESYAGQAHPEVEDPPVVNRRLAENLEQRCSIVLRLHLPDSWKELST